MSVSKRKPKKKTQSVVIDVGVHSDLKSWCIKHGMKVGVAAGVFIAWGLGISSGKEHDKKDAKE